MEHFAYIIQNQNGIFYKGYSIDIEKRILYHNSNKSSYTKNKGPWNLVFIKKFESKTDALRFEKMLKRQNHRYINWLVQSDKNEI